MAKAKDGGDEKAYMFFQSASGPRVGPFQANRAYKIGERGLTAADAESFVKVGMCAEVPASMIELGAAAESAALDKLRNDAKMRVRQNQEARAAAAKKAALKAREEAKAVQEKHREAAKRFAEKNEAARAQAAKVKQERVKA